MEDLVKLVAKKTGMSESIAQIAVTTVISSLKTKLPVNVGGMLDTYLTPSGKTASKSNNPLGDIGNIVGGLGGLLGKK